VRFDVEKGIIEIVILELKIFVVEIILEVKCGQVWLAAGGTGPVKEAALAARQGVADSIIDHVKLKIGGIEPHKPKKYAQN